MLEEAASTILVAPAGGPADAGWQTPAALVERLCAGRQPSRPFRRRCGTRTSQCGRCRRNGATAVVAMLRRPVLSFGRRWVVESRIVVQTPREDLSDGRAGVDARRPSDDARAAAMSFLMGQPRRKRRQLLLPTRVDHVCEILPPRTFGGARTASTFLRPRQSPILALETVSRGGSTWQTWR